MTEATIRFDDGAAYERTMGAWSRIVGDIFIDWLAPKPGLRWVDVGCGNGAFSELVIARCAPASLDGVDPSEGQLSFARTRPAARLAKFREGDAMALPYDDGGFDIAVMALVIFFVPDPAKGVAEMRRVVRPGGTVAAYAWDIVGGGFPHEPIQAAMRDMGLTPLKPPRFEVSQMDALRDLWVSSGFRDIETKEITVFRTFSDFDEFWAGNVMANIKSMLTTLPQGDLERLKADVRGRLPKDASGRITVNARANAVKGRAP
jgi:ubiquinone/menaquinone biosynthesis C-methylase UbiE